jgi:putative ABC transport system permease protein
MDSLGQVFPVIFFLVAALVSLTAMTRMVDEQRMQIGTMKALGYGGGVIVGRYFWYAVLATMGGGIAGVAVGERFLPYLISTSYGIMYTGMNEHLTPVNWDQAFFAIVAASASTGIATLAACVRQMKSRPAELMRPEAPKGGKRIFLEKIPLLWSRMNFTWKSTMRNLIRYKKRFVMTVIGVGGCMGLLLVGYGLKDSITEIAKQQYIQLFTYQAEATIDVNADKAEKKDVTEKASSFAGVTDTALVARKSVTLSSGGKERDADVFIPEKPEQIDRFLVLRDRVSREEWPFPKEGAYLTEKTAKMLGVSVGDTVRVEYEKKSFGIKVERISENYIMHYIFLAPETWKEMTGEEPDYNKLLINYEEKSPEEEDALGEELLLLPGCSGYTTITALEKQIDDMLGVLNDVMWVLIGSAGLLAFVVLYNLNSINILERKREMATLKVLGFYDREVAMYVFRENMILTLLGIVFGYVFGTILHRFTIVTVEVDLMMFGRTIRPESYLICALLTVVFSLLVNLFMSGSLKRIDMIESLKSVE